MGAMPPHYFLCGGIFSHCPPIPAPMSEFINLASHSSAVSICLLRSLLFFSGRHAAPCVGVFFLTRDTCIVYPVGLSVFILWILVHVT